jgi:hypothetical protein
MQPLKSIYKSPGFWEVDPKRTKVLPFPGKFPTRWAVTFVDGLATKIKFRLFTKPNPLVINSILRRAKEPGYVTLWEFDRGGAIQYCQRALPRQDFPVSKINAIVCGVYYPWHLYGRGFFDMWLAPIFHKKMKLGAHTFYIYSPYERMLNAGHSSVAKGLQEVAAKNQSVEEIDLGKLPPLPAVIRVQMHCPNCGDHFSKPEKYRNLMIRCDECGYAMVCR